MSASETATTMRAAVYRRPREVEISDHPVPEIGPEDVLVKVSHCGICGTDLHLILEGMGAPDSIPGHEWSGRVSAVGSAVVGFEPGALVIGGPSVRCGACDYCRAGRPSLCAGRVAFDPSYQGAFAEYIRVPAGQLLPVPDGLSLREAALSEPLSVALHALEVSGIEAGQRALVTGAGPIGLLIVAALRAEGVEDVRVSEPAPLRRERAGKVGASRLFAPDDLETPPMPFTVVDDPVDVVFECSGNPAAMESGLAQLRPMGRLVIVGTGMKRPAPRSQPGPHERAPGDRRLLLRGRRLRARHRAAGLGRAADRRVDRGRRRGPGRPVPGPRTARGWRAGGQGDGRTGGGS